MTHKNMYNYYVVNYFCQTNKGMGTGRYTLGLKINSNNKEFYSKIEAFISKELNLDNVKVFNIELQQRKHKIKI